MQRPGRAMRAGAGAVIAGTLSAFLYIVPMTAPAAAQASPLSCRTALDGSDFQPMSGEAVTSCCLVASEAEWYSNRGVAEDMVYRAGGRNVLAEACPGSIGAVSLAPDQSIEAGIGDDDGDIDGPDEIVVPVVVPDPDPDPL